MNEKNYAGSILVVDDDPVIAELLAKMLEKPGHTVQIAEDAGETFADKKVKVGILGVGLRGTWHLRLCLQRDDVEVKAVNASSNLVPRSQSLVMAKALNTMPSLFLPEKLATVSTATQERLAWSMVLPCGFRILVSTLRTVGDLMLRAEVPVAHDSPSGPRASYAASYAACFAKTLAHSIAPS